MRTYLVCPRCTFTPGLDDRLREHPDAETLVCADCFERLEEARKPENLIYSRRFIRRLEPRYVQFWLPPGHGGVSGGCYSLASRRLEKRCVFGAETWRCDWTVRELCHPLGWRLPPQGPPSLCRLHLWAAALHPRFKRNAGWVMIRNDGTGLKNVESPEHELLLLGASS